MQTSSCQGLSICYTAMQATPPSLRMHYNFSCFLPIFMVAISFPHAFWRQNTACDPSLFKRTFHSLQFPLFGCLWAQLCDGLWRSYCFVHYLAFFFLHNEDGSDISGGMSMFRLEVELTKHVKSEVIWGHLSEHVQEAVEYMGLERKKKGYNLFHFIYCCVMNHTKHSLLKHFFLAHGSAI